MKGILLVAAIHVLILHQAQKRKTTSLTGVGQHAGLVAQHAFMSRDKSVVLEHHPRVFWGVIAN